MRTSLIVGSMVFLISFGVYLSDNNRDKGKSSILPQSPSTHSLSYAETPLSFEPNLGQTNEEVKYLSRGEGYALFLATDEAVLSLGRDDEAGESISDVVRLQLIDALPNPTVRGIDPLGGRSNYFIGNDPTRWQRDVPHYTKVSYGEIYKGIDLVYYGTTQQQLEYDFIVSPGADPNDISLNFDGADSLYIDAEGKLILMMVGGEVVFDAPVTYQETNGEREFIDSRYLIGEAHQVTFDIDAYDQSRPLTIDPVLSYSTYMGGSGNESSAAIAIDGAGSAYVTGNTESLNYPTQNAAQSTLGGGAKDVFVTKLDPTGSAIAYSTYLGGSGIDRGNDIKVDSAGNAFIAGYTVSLLDFPLQNSLQSYGGGNSDAFLVKLDPSGSTILYSTLLGGNNNDAALEIQVDDTGNMYLAGYTTSTTFPVLNPIQSTNAGGEDAFLTKINPSGSSIIYSTYLGGNADDLCSGLAVDASGNVYMSGYATSSNFPLMNPMQPSPAGGLYDVFVAKVHASGSSLVYSTYLGGSAFDSNTDLAIDNTGNVYVTGWTESPDFPLQNPFQSTHGGASDAFVTKINASGSSLLYSTFLGGSSVELGKGIAVDDVGKIYLVGQVNSSNFPLRYPIQTHQAGSDAFVTVFNPSGSDLVYSTYLGGSDGNDVGQDIAIDNIGNVYVTGEVGGSTNFPTQNAYQGSNGGGTDYFVAKLTPVPDLQIDGQILFHSSRDGNLEIYKMDSDGSSQTRLTNNAVLDFQAAWSPDMSKIAYTSNLAGTTEIYVMDADGSNQVRLTNNTTADSDPTWSPDGAKIAFTSTRDGNSEIYVMNSDGTAPVNVTNTPHEEFKPSWSPSGDKITFTNEGDGNREIYVMNPDGTAKVRLTNNPATDSGATWSADGSKIAFRSDRDGNPEVYIMNADGNNQLRLTSDPADDLNPVWSPDGKRIAFISDRDAGPGKDEIYTMRIDGPNTSRLTDNLVNDVTYSWFTGYYIGKAVKGFSVNRIMTIKNNGSGDLIVSNIAFSDAQFTVSPSNFTVASGSSQQVTVTFTPTVANTTYSTLTITSNDPDSPATSLVINGTGETPVVSVTLPDTTSFYNQSISVPVRLSDTSNLGIVAAEVFVAYDGDLLTAFSAGTTGTLAANGWTVAENIVEGNGTNIDTIKIAMATDNDALVGAGDLININFQVADQRSPASSPLELVHVLFNDGVPDHTKTNGSVTLIGTDATIDSSPATIIPREVITVTVVDVDEDLDNNSADSFTVAVANGAQTETVTVTETGNNTGVFTGSIATVFSLGASSGDGTIQAKAGDQIVFTYTDQLDASGVAAPRTDQTDVVGGNDGAIRTTVVSQPGDTLRVVVTDADLNADTNTQESAQVTAVNPTTGESESIALSEDGVNSDIFFGIVKTAAGSSAGSLGDAALNTAKGDVLTISYLDDVTALGGTSVLQDDDEVVDPFGDADGNGSTQAFDAAQTLLHVLSPHLTGIDSLAANLDLLAYDPVQGRITPFDASLILQKRVGLIGRFPVQEDEADNHPQPQTDNSTPKRITDERRLSVVAGEGYVSVWADERRGIVSGELVLQEVVGVVEMGEELSGFLHAARSREDELHVVFAGAEGVSGAGELLRVYGVVEPDVHLVSASFNDGGIVGRAGESVAEIRPTSFALHPNAPNPFNPETQIGFSLATTGQVELVVYDILGQRVRTLVSTSMSAGVHSARWDGRDASGAQVSSGPYFYRLRAGDFVQTRRMILLK